MCAIVDTMYSLADAVANVESIVNEFYLLENEKGEHVEITNFRVQFRSDV